MERVIPPQSGYPPDPQGGRGEPAWWSTGRKADATEAESGDEWWEQIYGDQDSDLDTFTGNIPTPRSGHHADEEDHGELTQEDRLAAAVAAAVGPAVSDAVADALGYEEDEEGKRRPLAPSIPPGAKPRLAPGQAPPPLPLGERLRQPFPRFLAFYGSAAAVGVWTGAAAYLSQIPATAYESAGPLLASVAAPAVGYGVFRVTKTFTILWRAIAVFGSAELGRRIAPELLPWATQWAASHTPLSYDQVQLLAVGIPMWAATGYIAWATHRRSKSRAARWVACIPITSAVLASALYADGIL
ncbi:hypothetical protein AB0N09_05570 [Streptomyces erythrochromogenes]|uniref:hypothetical protein n=1 Tax=Streptomyces erythrochromogenes TaxID=285574 RepID=UPI003437EA11